MRFITCSMRKAIPVFTIMIVFFCTTGYTRNSDIDILRSINLQRNDHLDNLFLAVTNSAFLISAGIPVILLGTGLWRKDSTTLKNGFLIGVSLVTAASFSTLLKYGVDRPRPFETYPDIQKCTGGGSPSFPSGHTSDAFALATAVCLMYPKWYIIGPAFIWAGAVGYSRMDLGVHYPTDILAGALLGSASAYLCSIINKKLFKNSIG